MSQALTITGSGFVFDSNVTYNNVGHATNYVSATQLTILLTAKSGHDGQLSGSGDESCARRGRVECHGFQCRDRNADGNLCRDGNG